MDASVVIDIGRDALWVTLLLSGPLMIAGLVVGLVVEFSGGSRFMR